MARLIVLLLIISYGSCMKMRETVERTVMVRTSGSDLQPAATGFIYKRGTNGEAVVTKLGETEVMEQFSKLYDPQEFTSLSKNIESSENKQNSQVNQEKIVPVEEKTDLDGIADDDYKKIIDEYANNFDEYLKNLGNFKDYSNKEFGYDVHHDYEPKSYNDYDTKKYESYYLAREKPYGYDIGYKQEEDKHAYELPQNVAFRYKINEKDDKNKNSFHGDETKYHRGTPSSNGYKQPTDGRDDTESDENNSTTSNEESTTNSYAEYAKSGPVTGNKYDYKAEH